MDYKLLLKKYIELVKAMEGTDFLSDEGFDDISNEEMEELNRLSRGGE